MFKQYLEAHQYENDASGKFCLGLVSAAEELAQVYSSSRKGSGNETDQQDCTPYVHTQESQRHTDWNILNRILILLMTLIIAALQAPHPHWNF